MASQPNTARLQRAFGSTLRNRREKLGLSQEDLGFAAEVHRTYISELERGLKNPSLGTIARLAHSLRTTAGKLISDAESQLR